MLHSGQVKIIHYSRLHTSVIKNEQNLNSPFKIPSKILQQNIFQILLLLISCYHKLMLQAIKVQSLATCIMIELMLQTMAQFNSYHDRVDGADNGTVQ